MSTGNLIIVKTTQRNCLMWVISATCCGSSITKQNFLVAFCSVQRTVTCKKVNNGCEKPRTSMHNSTFPWHYWIIRHNYTMLSGSGWRDLIWRAMRSLADVRWGTRRWVRWSGQCMDFIWSREVLCGADWETKGLAARRYRFRICAQYRCRGHSVNRLWWLRVVCVYIRALWRPGVYATVLVDGLDWSHRCLRRICQSFDGVVPGGSPLCGWFQLIPISCRRCLNHSIVVCGTLKRLARSAVFKLVCSISIVLSRRE